MAKKLRVNKIDIEEVKKPVKLKRAYAANCNGQFVSSTTIWDGMIPF